MLVGFKGVMNVEGELEGETDTKGDVADDADFFFFMAGGMTGLGHKNLVECFHGHLGPGMSHCAARCLYSPFRELLDLWSS